MNIRKRALRRLMLAASVTSALMGGLPAVAPAATLTADYMGAAGAYTTFTWQSKTRIEPLYLRVEDNKCDGMGVYAFFEVEYLPGYIWLSQKRGHTGCNGYTNYNSYINDRRGIYRVRLYACRDEPNADWCKSSGWSYNPYLSYPSVDTGVSLPVMLSEAPLGGDGVIASGG